jgi:hypothetical protein
VTKRKRIAPLLEVVTVRVAAGWLTACADNLPAGLASEYRYEAVFETVVPPDTVVGRVRLTSTAGDSIFGTFEDLDPDPGDAAQFGTEFPVNGVVKAGGLDFRISAPGVRIDHEGTLLDGTIVGTCSAGVIETPQPLPCVFTMWPG